MKTKAIIFLLVLAAAASTAYFAKEFFWALGRMS